MARSAVRESGADAVAGRSVLREIAAFRGSVRGNAVREAGGMGESERGERDGDGGERADVPADRDALRASVFRRRGVHEGRRGGRNAA